MKKDYYREYEIDLTLIGLTHTLISYVNKELN